MIHMADQITQRNATAPVDLRALLDALGKRSRDEAFVLSKALARQVLEEHFGDLPARLAVKVLTESDHIFHRVVDLVEAMAGTSVTIDRQSA